jgi:DNA-binding MarR family transcriptional regulator
MLSTDPLAITLQEWVQVSMRRSMRNFIRYARDSGLSMSQIGALFHIHHQGSCGVTDLGESLGVTSAAASQMLERLVQQGLILRSEDPIDRRVKQLVLTEKGSRVIQESIQARQGWLGDLPRMFSPNEKEQVVAALKILINKAKQLENIDKTEI